MMANKLFKKGMLLLASTMVLGLASCGEVDAELPTSIQEEKIVNLANKLPDNNIKEIYDAIVTSGDSNSERILNKLLYLYGQSYFGAFYGEGGLKEVIENPNKAADYATKHSEAFADKEEVLDFANIVKTSLQKSFWDIRNNSSYQERGIFYERLFHRAETKNLYNLKSVADPKKKLLLGSENYKDVDLYFTDFLTTYEDYIERNLLSNVYRKALVKDYLINENSGVLGRAYARKVQYIGLADISSSASATNNLVRAFCELCISADGVADEFRDLNFLNRLYSGTVKNTAEELAMATAVYTRAGWTASPYADDPATPDVDESQVYVETTMGATLKDYNELNTDRNVTGSTTDFTSSGSYTKEIGLMIKEREILKSNKVNEGWYNSSSLSGLLTSIKDRLFDTFVGREVDVLDKSDDEKGKKGSFGWYVQGSYYMVPEKMEKSEKYPYAIYDKSSSTWYICRVDQAVTSGKLNADRTDDNYDNANVGRGFGTDGKVTINEVNWEVANLLADTDSYKNACNQNIVKKLALSYHDDTVYSYFEKTFPDLFD